MILLKIGARGSPLSLAQTNLMVQQLEQYNIKAEIIIIKTSGDKILNTPLYNLGGKGLFVKEIEEALLAENIDIAVHSAKDLPSVLPSGLTIGAVPKREDPRDILISNYSGGLKGLPKNAVLGTSGLRRKAQILAVRPDLQIKPLRGNVGTRLKKLEEGYEATILAAAGLKRLNIKSLNKAQATVLNPKIMLPAVGQGALVLEIKEDNLKLKNILNNINHQESNFCLKVERAFLKILGSGCQIPVAAWARFEEGKFVFEGLIAALNGTEVIESKKEFLNININNKDDLHLMKQKAQKLAHGLLENGGRKIMESIL